MIDRIKKDLDKYIEPIAFGDRQKMTEPSEDQAAFSSNLEYLSHLSQSVNQKAKQNMA